MVAHPSHVRQQLVYHQLEEIDILIDIEGTRHRRMHLPQRAHLLAFDERVRRPPRRQPEGLRLLKRRRHA